MSSVPRRIARFALVHIRGAKNQRGALYDVSAAHVDRQNRIGVRTGLIARERAFALQQAGQPRDFAVRCQQMRRSLTEHVIPCQWSRLEGRRRAALDGFVPAVEVAVAQTLRGGCRTTAPDGARKADIAPASAFDGP